MKDTIYRDDAIDAILDLSADHRVSWKDAVIDTLDELPSAEPERNFLSGLTPEAQYDKLKWLFIDYGIQYTDSRQAIIQWLASQPERRGKWILHENQRQEDVDNGNYLYICSECGRSDIHAKTQEVPFCWYCGAKMEGKE